MGKSGRYGPANRPQSFARSNQIRSELPTSFTFNDGAPSNTLYPDPASTPRSKSGLVQNNNFLSDNRPPWQINRGTLEYNQIPRGETPPWNRVSASDSRSKDPQDWNNSRQSTSYNQRNDQINSIGWAKQDEIIPQWKKQDSLRMDMRGDGPWNDRSTAVEKGGWNLPKGANESPIRPQGLLESGQMERFRGGPSSGWSNQRDGSKEAQHWFDMPHKPDWSDKPVRHPDVRERSLVEEWYDSFRGSAPGPVNDSRSREDSLRNRFDRPENDEWYQQRRQPESLMKNYPDRDSNNRDWNNKPRNYDDPEWMNRPRHDQNPVWFNPPRLDPPSLRSVMSDISMPDEPSFSRASGPIGGPFSERDYERKRGRSPENRDVWSRLEPQGVGNDKHINKKFRANEQLDRGIGEDVLAVTERERMELINKATPLMEQQPRPLSNDLRLKMSRPPPGLQPKYFQVYIVPQSKKRKFQMKDKDQIYDKLVADLHKMAQSDNLEGLPQLRFYNCEMVRRTRIVINCHDAATTKWLLDWDQGVTRIPLRKVLPDDCYQLAIISFNVKGPCSVTAESMKHLLKTQNPKLDISCWADGEVKTSKKGKMYVYKVDGHTLRYLVHNKWELYFDLQKLYVRRIKTNFDYNPQELASL